MPVSLVFENLELRATIEEIMEWHDLSREQIVKVLDFTARSLDAVNAAAPGSYVKVPIPYSDGR